MRKRSLKRCSRGVILVAAAGLLRIAPIPALAAAENARLAFVQVPRSAAQPAGGGIDNTVFAGRYLLGMRIVAAELEDVGGTARVVSEGFACATDPVFTHDASRLAFAGKPRPQDPLQIWELSAGALGAGAAAQREPRQIVAWDADCVGPVYMPSGHVVFASLAAGEYEEHGGHYSLSLYELAPGSRTPTRLTFNPSSDFDPVVLPDGRICYSSWQHVGNHLWPRGVVALMLVNSDGTGVFPLTGNHRSPWLKRGARPFGKDGIAFIQADRLAHFGAGTLMATSMNDAFAPYSTLIPADEYLISGVAPLPGGRLLLSARPAAGTRATFGLYVYEEGMVKPVYDDPAYHELAPAAGAPTGRPELRVSTVVPDTPHGYLLVLNCYETDRSDQHRLRQGAVGTVRVIEGRPVRHNGPLSPEFFAASGRQDEPLVRPNSATGYIPARILGEVPPAADGSIYLKVPADRPLRLQLVDHEGFTIVNERAWFWVRPNERRVCVGCHEDRELSPHNVTALAARRQPTDLTGPSGWETVSFRRDIQPIVTANCAVSDCHVPPRPTGGMNLTADRLNGGKDAALADRFGPAYANLLARQENKPFAVGGRRVHPGDSRRSPMLWMLYGRALAAQYNPAPFDTPIVTAHPGPMLPAAQLELIRKWIDLGAQYDDESPLGPWPYQFPPLETMEASSGTQ
ncbi:MAG: HzsA-related protein [Planctomycetota bacterium]